MTPDYSRIREAFERDQFAQALQIADRLLQSHPEEGRVWELKGLIHHAIAEYQQAINSIERASLLVPLNPAASICLGQCYGRVGRLELSKDLLAPMIEDPRMTPDLLLQIATGLDVVDHPELALSAARQATVSDPFHAQAYYDMGFYASRCGQPPHLVESLARKALSLDPEHLGYRMALVTYLLKNRRNDDAFSVIRGISQTEIDSIRCRCCLERVVNLFEERGDYRRAILCRQQALRLELENIDPDCQ